MSELSQALSGTFRALLLFDIAEAIDLRRLQEILGTIGSTRREPAFRHPAPDYVRFEKSPVVEQLGHYSTNDGHALLGRIRYFDYGVASVELRLQCRGDWQQIVDFANRWIMSPELEGLAGNLLRERLAGKVTALKKPNEGWTFEDYYVVQVDPIHRDGSIVTADILVRDYGAEIAQIVRGEAVPLSVAERQEVLQSTMSYYPADLLVVGWVGAFVYDTPAAAEPTIDLLEYANSQLLEFRYYDDVLTRVLAHVYQQLDRKRSMWARWRLATEAENLNTIRLDYQELAERTENAIKFVSDMFYARAYRLAAARIGVNDYRSLVTGKLQTARDLYDSMVNEFHQGRAFFLEVMVVIILIVEIVFLFKGKG
ncbi:MAG TPA: hypothetical protein VH302_05900 [Bryobacteraceae bacterium]|jgi:hypothetical protein|nr:hypothetical protein [Bryobacteraceae bacterium]